MKILFLFLNRGWRLTAGLGVSPQAAPGAWKASEASSLKALMLVRLGDFLGFCSFDLGEWSASCSPPVCSCWAACSACPRREHQHEPPCTNAVRAAGPPHTATHSAHLGCAAMATGGYCSSIEAGRASSARANLGPLRTRMCDQRPPVVQAELHARIHSCVVEESVDKRVSRQHRPLGDCLHLHAHALRLQRMCINMHSFRLVKHNK